MEEESICEAAVDEFAYISPKNCRRDVSSPSTMKTLTMNAKAPTRLSQFSEKYYPSELQVKPAIKPEPGVTSELGIARSRFRMNRVLGPNVPAHSDYMADSSVSRWKPSNTASRSELFSSNAERRAEKNIPASILLNSPTSAHHFYIAIFGVMATAILIYLINKKK